jgi:hypothetical protein
MERNQTIHKPVLHHHEPIYIYDYYHYILYNPNLYLKLFQSLYLLNIHLFNQALHPKYDMEYKCIPNKLFLFPVEAYSWSEELAKKNYTCEQLFSHLFLHDNNIVRKQHLLYQMMVPFIKNQGQYKLSYIIDPELEKFYDNHNIFMEHNFDSPPNNFRKKENKQKSSEYLFIFSKLFGSSV